MKKMLPVLLFLLLNASLLLLKLSFCSGCSFCKIYASSLESQNIYFIYLYLGFPPFCDDWQTVGGAKWRGQGNVL